MLITIISLILIQTILTSLILFMIRQDSIKEINKANAKNELNARYGKYK